MNEACEQEGSPRPATRSCWVTSLDFAQAHMLSESLTWVHSCVIGPLDHQEPVECEKAFHIGITQVRFPQIESPPLQVKMKHKFCRTFGEHAR